MVIPVVWFHFIVVTLRIDPFVLLREQQLHCKTTAKLAPAFIRVKIYE
jgi:hypothetical protein